MTYTRKHFSYVMFFTLFFCLQSLALAKDSFYKNYRDVYYPGTETLHQDEMRVVACGTGMPMMRPKQASACWLVELGNGEKFIFDIGSGSGDNIAALLIPSDDLDKIFITHLHSDHFADLPNFFISGWTNGRSKNLRVWGPKGPPMASQKGLKVKKDLSIKSIIAGMRQMLAWDIETRGGRLPLAGGTVKVVEEVSEDKALNNGGIYTVYNHDGVVIKAWPAYHVIPGAVAYSLEWKGLKFVYGGDSFPTKWYAKNAKGATLAVHECFILPEHEVERVHFPVDRALDVAVEEHTTPAAFGKLMHHVQPKMAIAYHFFNDFDTVFDMYDRVRSQYKGRLIMAEDMMVWNIRAANPDDIKVRKIVYNDSVWSPPVKHQPKEGDSSPASDITLPKEIEDGKLDVKDVVNEEYCRTNKKYKTHVLPKGVKSLKCGM